MPECHPVKLWRIYKSEMGGTRGYISGVHFQKWSKFSILFRIKFSAQNTVHPQGGQAQGPPKYALLS